MTFSPDVPFFDRAKARAARSTEARAGRSTEARAARSTTRAADTPLIDNTILIGLGGAKEAGKDAVADILATASDVTKMGMSDVLNEILLVLNPLIPSVSFPDRDTMRYADHIEVVGYTEAKTLPEVRRLLQTMGTEVGRNMIDPDVWVNVMAAKVAASRAAGVSVVVTGIRYPNELQMIRDLGGVSVYVTRPATSENSRAHNARSEHITREHETRIDAHSSELHTSETTLSIEDFDLSLVNDGTFDDLRIKALLLIDTVLTVQGMTN